MKARILGLTLAATFAMPTTHAAVMQFDFTVIGADGSTQNVKPFTYTASESPIVERANEAVAYRDESYVFGNNRYIYHYLDTSFDQTSSRSDRYSLNLDSTTGAQDFVYIKGTVSYDPASLPANASLNALVSASGTYTPRVNPLFPNVALLPGAPTIAMAQSTNPADLAMGHYAISSYTADGTFFSAHSEDVVLNDTGRTELEFLLYGGTGLTLESSMVYLTGYSYVSTERLTESRFIGMEILPVPEPSTWAMLLAGVGILGIARRRKNAA
jgi:PEP-CTERM motif